MSRAHRRLIRSRVESVKLARRVLRSPGFIASSLTFNGVPIDGRVTSIRFGSMTMEMR